MEIVFIKYFNMQKNGVPLISLEKSHKNRIDLTLRATSSTSKNESFKGVNRLITRERMSFQLFLHINWKDLEATVLSLLIFHPIKHNIKYLHNIENYY